MRSGGSAMIARRPSAASSAVRTSCPALARCTRKRSRNVRSSSMITILANCPSCTRRGSASKVFLADALEILAPAPLEQVRVAHAVSDQSAHRLEKVFGRRPQLAARAHQGLDDGLQRKLAGVIGVRAVNEEGYRPQRFPGRVDLRPARRVGAEHHFAPPQEPQLLLRAPAGDAVRDAAAAAAGIQAEDQTGFLPRAAVDVRPQAEAAVKAVQPRDAVIFEADYGIPHERAVAEKPYVRARLMPVENFPERVFLLRVGEHRHLRIEPAERRPQEVVLEVGAGEGHATRLSPKGTTRGIERAARIPSSSLLRGGGA